MSTDERPGMAINEDEVERHVQETREQAKRANYPEHSTPLHGSVHRREEPVPVPPPKAPRAARKGC